MNNKTDWLTALRGIACMIVLIVHLVSTIPEVGLNLSGCGKIGVWLFFVLSALLLTLQWIKEERVTIKNVFSFYIKRFFRIYPCYIIVLLFALIIGYFESFKLFFTHLFLLDGKGHFWTIPVECFFYIIIPLIILLLKKMRKKQLKIIFLFVLGGIFELVFPYFLCLENSINLMWYISVFLIGMMLAYVFIYFENNPKKSIIWDIIVVIQFIIIIISIPYFRKILFNIQPDRYLQNKFIYFGLIWSIIIIAIQNSKYIKSYLNKSKILVYLGKISFPVYLIHYILIGKIRLENQFLSIGLIVILTIIISIILNKLIEIPMIKISKKIINIINKKSNKEEKNKRI